MNNRRASYDTTKGGPVLHCERRRNDPEREVEIDVTLALLCRIRRPGVEIPSRVISELCGMSHAGAHAIQERALRKLRVNPKFNLMSDGLEGRDFAA